MGNGRNIFNQMNLQSSGLKGSQGRFSSGSGAFDVHIDGPHAMLHGLLGGIVRCHLRREGSAFSGALETLCAGTRPRHHITLFIGDGDDRVVERRLNVCDTGQNILLHLLFLYPWPFVGHNSSLSWWILSIFF